MNIPADRQQNMYSKSRLIGVADLTMAQQFCADTARQLRADTMSTRGEKKQKSDHGIRFCIRCPVKCVANVCALYKL